MYYERILNLKKRAYENGKHRDENILYLIYFQALQKFKDERFHNLKRARIDRYLMENYKIEIDPEEWIVGRFAFEQPFTEEEQKEYDIVHAYAQNLCALNGSYGGGTNHRVIDYEKLLSVGVNGILKEIETYKMQISYDDPQAAQKQIFYQSVEIELDGLLTFASRYRDALINLAQQTADAARKKEYERLASIFSHIPANPANDFYEAIQCVWFVEYAACLCMDTVLSGRPDQYLYPYYKKGIADGTLTDDFVQALIDNFYLKHNEIYDTWPASVMIGGTDRQGNPVWNRLSEMLIDSIERTGLVNPSVAVCYNEAMPEKLLSRCVDMIADGYTRPSIFNDRIVTAGLLDAGTALEDARNYIHSTCVEITPIAASNIMVATPYINLCKSLEYLLGDGKALFGADCHLASFVSVSKEELNTFEGFLSKTKEVIAQILKAELTAVCEEAYWKKSYSSCPLVSAFTNDCLAKGMDSAAGGARYNFVYPCFPGFLTLVDSLSAIRTAVYENKLLSLSDLGNLLKNNFQNAERVRKYLINKCPKFGNDEDAADQIAVTLYEFIREELSHYRTCTGGTFHPSYFAWIMHGILGKESAATPDGRMQSEALSECLASVQGMDKKGPLAVMRSVSKLEQKYGIGGIASNFRFSRSMLHSDAGKQALADFIRTFMRNDCFEIQFNVVDQQTLLEAREHPEAYQTLLVRVAGYSDYFVNLDPVIQNEIIRRSEHGDI